jgi:hypothetical protein
MIVALRSLAYSKCSCGGSIYTCDNCSSWWDTRKDLSRSEIAQAEADALSIESKISGIEAEFEDD